MKDRAVAEGCTPVEVEGLVALCHQIRTPEECLLLLDETLARPLSDPIDDNRVLQALPAVIRQFGNKTTVFWPGYMGGLKSVQHLVQEKRQKH